MKLNQQLVQINRNFVICFIVSALSSAAIAQILSDTENYINTTVTVAIGYAIYFVVFAILFWFDNKNRYRQMHGSLIKREIIAMISSFGIGEIGYLIVRWPTFYYFLEINIEPFFASLTSEIIATIGYMVIVTIFLRKTKTF
ncbi:MAG: hypothetical protein R3327_01050 [Nitrosopumilaceae archaeon]|nr:hypothetical protein [Nitrosopumilaceae archaeon]